jgi:hypothetical protein
MIEALPSKDLSRHAGRLEPQSRRESIEIETRSGGAGGGMKSEP